MVELPYKGDDLSMVVVAPNDPAGLPAIEEKLTPENLDQWIGHLRKRDTQVHLPKFKLETDYTLGDEQNPAALQRMGMVRAFKDPRDPKTGAQFYGMTTSTDPMEQLYITKVLHKAFVEVNEKGTEAAAATAVVMAMARSRPASRPFIPEFKADRPFVFLIRDKATGSVLFLGRMTKPAS
jgi:serine protease inhibitor